MKWLYKLILALFLVTFTFHGLADLAQAQLSADQISCEQQTGIDVSSYVAPRCDGNSCEPIAGSSIGNGFAWIGNVTNQVTWEDTNTGIFKQNSNEIHFLYQDSGGTIKILQDTIWGNADGGFFYCDGTQDRAMYRWYSGGTWGRSILDSTMDCGGTHTSTGQLRTYRTPAEIESDPDMNLSGLECNVSGQTGIPVTGAQQLIFQGSAMCNGVPVEAIATTNISGAGAAEVFMYCLGQGLCSWYASIDFEKDPPSSWTSETDICNLEGGVSSALDRDPYYVEPINGMLDYAANGFSDPGNQIFDRVYEDLIAQGYQAWCTTPSTDLVATDDSSSFMLENMLQVERSSGNRVVTTISDYEQFFDYIDAQAPIWRNRGVYVLTDKDSLEAFWSHKDEQVRIENVPIEYSPAFALTDPVTQCREKKKILEAVNLKCNTLEEPNTCALDVSYHPDSMKFWELYKAIQQTNFDCSKMDESEESLSELENEIKNSLLNMPYAMPTAYRFAFVVYSAELREPRVSGEFGTVWSQAQHKPGFDFLRFDPLRSGDQLARPRSEVRILAFLVPDFATNQDNIDFTYTQPPEVNYPNFPSGGGPRESRQHIAKYGSDNLNFLDSVRLVRNSQLTPTQQQKYIDQWRQKKENDNFDEITAAGFFPDGEVEKLIECLYWNGEPAPEEYRCDTPLEMALTTFVNRRVENPEACQSTNDEVYDFEENDSIFSPAGIALEDDGLNQFHKGSPYNLLLDGLYPQNVANAIDNERDTSLGEPVTDPLRKVYSFHFLSHYAHTSFGRAVDPIDGVAEPIDDEKNVASIYSYLIYPQGYELEAIEETLLGVFLSPKQIEEFNLEIEEEKIPKYYKMRGVDQIFDEVTVTGDQQFADRSEADCLIDYSRNQPTGEDGSLLTYGEFRERECVRAPEVSIHSDPDPIFDREPRLLGATFGRITIKIQQSLRIAGSVAWEYITSCLESDSPTEDFLLGRCSGIVADDQTTQPGSTDRTGVCIETFVDPAVAESYAAELRSNLPKQLDEGLWQRYYSGYIPDSPQYLFEDCDGVTPCYNLVIERALSINLNPYLAIAIALNETGGLKSVNDDRTGPHFGCGVDPNRPGYISSQSIEDKLKCMIGFFNRNQSLSADEALSKYGYRDGNKNNNISTLIGLLSYQRYEGSCSP